MSVSEIRLPITENLSRWAVPLTPLALAFAALADHANIDATPAAIESMRIADPASDPSEKST